MTPQLHPDANEILARLRKEGITALYHFTCVENLPYICQAQQLWSKQKLEDEGKWPSLFPGGDSLSHRLDRYNGNWDKVSLSLTPFTPMAYRKKRNDHLCYFYLK
jgi:ssDNA thymidine ADP-ribosyltransferase, DarT